jgi:hypothetical protein
MRVVVIGGRSGAHERGREQTRALGRQCRVVNVVSWAQRLGRLAAWQVARSARI